MFGRNLCGQLRWSCWLSIIVLVNPVGFAFASDSRVALDRVIVKLRGDVGLVAPRALAEGFAGTIRDPAASELDELLRANRVHTVRRLFRSFDAKGSARPATARERVAAIRARSARQLHPLSPSQQVPDLENYFVLEMPPAPRTSTIELFLEQLRENELVVAAQADGPTGLLGLPLPSGVTVVPSGDTAVIEGGNSWVERAENLPSAGAPNAFGLANIRALEAWTLFDLDGINAFQGETAPGEGIIVAVIDGGFETTHPDLAPSLWVNDLEANGTPGVDDDGNGHVDDIHGWNFNGDNAQLEFGTHGTPVAGIIAADMAPFSANNGLTVGVAPFAELMLLRASGTNLTAVASAVWYAVDQGASVINYSGWSLSSDDVVLRDAFDAAELAGVLAFAAAGNDARFVHYPALLPSVVAVGAADHQDVRASFSARGSEVEVLAPFNSAAAAVGGTAGWFDGTSAASPHVAGAAAALMSFYPSDPVSHIRGRLLAGADLGPTIVSKNQVEVGNIGFGRLDLLGSMQATPTPVVDLLSWRHDPLGAGDTVSLSVDVRNYWIEATGVTATLAVLSGPATLSGATASVGTLPSGDSSTIASLTFGVLGASSLKAGDEISLRLTLDGDGGFHAELPFSIYGSTFDDTTDALGGLAIDNGLAWHAAAADFTGDGRAELAVADTIEVPRLYRQRADGSFKREFVSGSGGMRDQIFVDLDGDGHLDHLEVGRSSFGAGQGSRLRLNEGWGEFTLAPGSMINNATRADTALPADIDEDGDIDLIFSYPSSSSPFVPTFILQNDGFGVFTNIGARGIDSTLRIHRMLSIDHNGNGHPDLITVSGSDTVGHLIRIFENDGSGQFADATSNWAPACSAPCPQPRDLAAGDYDNDGDLDLYLAASFSMDDDAEDKQGGFLLMKASDGSFEVVESTAFPVQNFSGGRSGSAFFDLDNDGHLDIISSWDRWTHLRQPIFRNNGDGTFSEHSGNVWGAGTLLATTAIALGDFNLDGRVDVFGAMGAGRQFRGGLALNVVEDGGRWLEIRLLPDLVQRASAPNGLGAKIRVQAHGQEPQLREVHHSPSQVELVHFGLGTADVAGSIEVEWPSGLIQILSNVPLNRIRNVREMQSVCPGDNDSDADGVCDAEDNCLYAANGPWDASNQVDSDLDGYGNACDADLNNDGSVDAADESLGAGAEGLVLGDSGYLRVADLDGDNQITAHDLAILSLGVEIADTPGPSGLSCADANGATAPCVAPGTPCVAEGDADGDRVCDPDDNCLHAKNGNLQASDQVDGDLDGYGNACDPDLDGDGIASLLDVSVALNSIGLSAGDLGYNAEADIDGDDRVTSNDVGLIKDASGTVPGPSGLACANPSGATAPCEAN